MMDGVKACARCGKPLEVNHMGALSNVIRYAEGIIHDTCWVPGGPARWPEKLRDDKNDEAEVMAQMHRERISPADEAELHRGKVPEEELAASRKQTPVEEATVKAMAELIDHADERFQHGIAPHPEDLPWEKLIARQLWDEIVEPLRVDAMTLGADLAMRRAKVGVVREHSALMEDLRQLAAGETDGQT